VSNTLQDIVLTVFQGTHGRTDAQRTHAHTHTHAQIKTIMSPATIHWAEAQNDLQC